MHSLIIPVYRNESGIPDLVEAVEVIGKALYPDFEAIFVVDGSPDQSHRLLKELLPLATFRSQLLDLSRNFGSFSAVRAGLEVAQGTVYAVMAADLQEPPELTIRMFKEVASGAHDAAVGFRDGRDDPWLSRLPAQLFWWAYRKYVMPQVPVGGVDVFCCNQVFRNALLGLRESHSSLIAQIFWLGFRVAHVPYRRLARQHGKSAWTLKKRLNYLMDSVFSFTDLPIRLLVRLGIFGSLASIFFGVVLIIARSAGLITVPGYAPIMLAITFFGSLNLAALGIVGSYAWRAYENTKARPLAVVLTHQNFPS
jgi:polyisoprenyl-phosphate glycosyltransferase